MTSRITSRSVPLHNRLCRASLAKTPLFDSLWDGFDAIERAQSSEELRGEIDKFARQSGFEKFAYVLSVHAPTLKAQQHVISGYPQRWVDRYVSNDYFEVDPVIRHAQRSTLPLIWDFESIRNGESVEFWEEAKAFGLQFGLSLGVHEHPGLTGIFSFSRDKPVDQKGSDLAALIGRAQVFASLFHRAASRIAVACLLPADVKPLTARELECLRWAAEGKTAWEVARILQITERTAVFHLRNSTRKLRAVNKTQAVVRAIALGMI